MSRKKKVLVGCVGVLLVLFIAGVVHHYRVKGAVERYKAELIATGEQLSIEQCLPPPVPAESTRAALFLSVTTNFVYEGPLATNGGSPMIMIAPGSAMVGWAQPWFGGGTVPWFSNSWEEALADLAARNSELSRLAAITDQPVLQFDTDFTDGYFNAKSLVRFLPGLKQAAQLLGAAAQCEMNRGNRAEATQYVHAELAIVQGTADDRWLITQLVRAAVAELGAFSTWALLQSENLAEADLRELQTRWSSLAFIEALEHSFQMERAVGIHAFQRTRKSCEDFETVAGPLFSLQLPLGQSERETSFLGLRKGWARLKFHLANFIWRYWWSYSTEFEFLKRSQNGLEQCRAAVADGNGLRSLSIHEEFVSANPINDSDERWGVRGFKGLRSRFGATWTKAFDKSLTAETIKRLTITAIALQRYQLMYGTYPECLSELEPEFLDRVPVDPMDGGPLRYQLVSDSEFLLYSVGENRRDEGGDPQRYDGDDHYVGRPWPRDGRDWVWPQVGSEKEVLAYWKKEVTKNYARLFRPEGADNPYAGVPYEALEPMINPETGRLVLHPDTGRVMLAPDGEQAGKEWQQRIDRLAHEWTEQYFRLLTNPVTNADKLHP